MASLASLGFWISITVKVKFSILDLHHIIHNICLFLNVFSNFGNLFLFGLSFNDYFEYKEHKDYLQLLQLKSNAAANMKND
jgi:hypothetical protein